MNDISTPSKDRRPALPAATLRDYIAMARPDHWIKHVFIVPGLVLAYILHPTDPRSLGLGIVLGFASACAIASANYVINEWLDAKFDRFHPIKSQRPAVSKRLSRAVIIGQYLLLAVLGLALAAAVNPLFLACSIAFLVSGLIYNVPGIRTKDRAYLDVVSEAVNNPLRLTLGWAMVSPSTLPPSSLLLAYWMGGAFLMAIKRFAEYRAVAASGRLDDLGLYRRSFRYYTDDKLLVSAFLYAQMAAFFLAVFLVKYRIEYLLTLPIFAALFAVYLRVGLKRESVAQAPERLFKEHLLMAVVVILVLALALLTWVDLPFLERLADPHYIHLTTD